MSSDFDMSKPHGRQQTFGNSRDKCKAVIDGGTYLADMSIPAPGKYYNPPSFGSDGSKFSMRGKNT